MKMENLKMNVKLMTSFLLIVQGISINAEITVHEKSNITIKCPLTGDIQFPTWTGPSGLANPLTSGQTINEPGLEWVNNTDLRLISARVKHDGKYTCSDAASHTATVELNVEYLSAWAEFSPASASNPRTVLTCDSHSNPDTRIIPHVTTRIRDITDNSDMGSNITFHPCEPDPARENKTRCSVTVSLPVSKEDNGLEMSCEFVYKNRSVLTLFPKVDFRFPPTKVNISGNRNITYSAHMKLNLTCTTDSSNHVSRIIWRRGNNDVIWKNDIIKYAKNNIQDAEYNGKNISSTVNIMVDGSMNGEHVYCCAQHAQLDKDICDSIILKDVAASAAGCVIGNLTMALLVTFLAFISA